MFLRLFLKGFRRFLGPFSAEYGRFIHGDLSNFLSGVLQCVIIKLDFR